MAFWTGDNGRAGDPGIATGSDATDRLEAISVEPVPGSARLVYRVDGGGWITTAMTQGSPNSYTATIPAAECESLVEYYVSASATGGGTF